MHDEDTICYKISRSIEDVENAIKTGSLDAGGLGLRLHEIRDDAQRMEDAIKARKAFMTKANIEEAYQKDKAKRSKTNGINKIAQADEVVTDRVNFEFIVKRDNEVIYQQASHAGVVCVVEKIHDMDPFGQITGETQMFHYGHILSVFFAFDQLRQKMEGKNIAFLSAIRDRVLHKKNIDPAVKKKVMDEINL